MGKAASGQGAEVKNKAAREKGAGVSHQGGSPWLRESGRFRFGINNPRYCLSSRSGSSRRTPGPAPLGFRFGAAGAELRVNVPGSQSQLCQSVVALRFLPLSGSSRSHL